MRCAGAWEKDTVDGAGVEGKEAEGTMKVDRTAHVESPARDRALGLQIVSLLKTHLPSPFAGILLNPSFSVVSLEPGRV